MVKNVICLESLQFCIIMCSDTKAYALIVLNPYSNYI